MRVKNISFKSCCKQMVKKHKSFTLWNYVNQSNSQSNSSFFKNLAPKEFYISLLFFYFINYIKCISWNYVIFTPSYPDIINIFPKGKTIKIWYLFLRKYDLISENFLLMFILKTQGMMQGKLRDIVQPSWLPTHIWVFTLKEI